MLNMKKRLFVALILPLFLSACGGAPDFKALGIKKIAVISVRTDTVMHTMSQDGASEFINVIHDISKGALEGDSSKRLSEEEEFFIFSMMEDLRKPVKKWAASYDIEFLNPDIVASNNLYSNLHLSAAETGVYYSSPPFRNIDQPDAKTLKELCASLGVDALATFRVYFERESYRDAFQLPFTPDFLKLYAKVDLMVFDKNGVTLLQQRIQSVSPEIIGFDKSEYHFSFKDEDMKRVIIKTIDALKDNVDLQLSAASGS
jgi:hypothetical protein